MIPCFSQGGVEHSLITAINNIPLDLFDVSVFIRTNETELVSELPRDVNVILNKKKHYYRHPKVVLLMIALKLLLCLKLEKKATDVQERLNEFIHSQKIKHPVKSAFKNKKYDVIVSYTVDDCTEMASMIPARRRYVFYHTPYVDFKSEMIETEMEHYDAMIACGPGVYDALKAIYGNKYKIRLLSNYVDREEILCKANECVPVIYQECLRKEWVLCTCGRLAPAKRYDLAIEAAELLKESGISFIWFLVGGGDSQKQLETLIKSKDLSSHIYITGNQNNPYPFIKNCDIYVQTSGFEAQPLAIIEAMKLGKPVVSTNTLGGRTILENGEKGILTDISANEIAEGIMQYMMNPSLKEKMENQYTAEMDLSEKKEYARKWIELLEV